VENQEEIGEPKHASSKVYHLLLAALFVGVMLFPTVDSLMGFTANMPNTERRVFAKFPDFQLRWFGEFIDDFDVYFKDNFGGRKLFIKGYCWVKLHIFNTSPYPENVILGKDKWLFLGKSKGGTYEEHLGIRVLNKRQLNRMKTNVIDNKNWAEEKGMKYYLFVAPDKYSIYPEKLPENYSKKHIRHNLDRFIHFMKPDLKVIDIREELLAKKEETLLYGYTDSHWTQYGAYIGYKKVINTLRKDFPGIPTTSPINAFRIDTVEIEGHKEMPFILNADNYFKDYNVTLTRKQKPSFRKVKNKLKLPRGFRFDKKSYEVRYVGKAKNKLKIVVIRDSFSNRLKKFLPAHFRETVFIGNGHKFNKKILEKEKPDIILHEIVERVFSESLMRY